MARIGRNPNTNKRALERITDVVLTSVVHLPNLQGYHANRLKIVQKCLKSMRDHAGGNYTVIIWDNGSCQDFQKWVQREYQPDIYIESSNIGKSAARAALFGMLDPDTIVNYSDDDIYHYPNWLLPQIKLLKHFPDVSCVTGYPLRTAFRWGVKNTITRLKPTYGRFLPQKWEEDYAVSVGMDKARYIEESKNFKDIIVEYKGLKAYATSHHCQHIGFAGLLRDVAWNSMIYGSMPDEKPYDIEMDKMGNRLATLERYTRHMGNVIDDDLRRDILNAEKAQNDKFTKNH